MAEMVGSTVAQETVSRAVSFLLSKHEEKASRAHNIERLEMAHSELGFALEISDKLPIIDPSLLDRRKMFKRAYEECGDVLHRCKLRVLEEEGGDGEPGVTARSSSLACRFFHAVKSFVSSSVSQKNDELGSSNVKRFEWYANKAGKFVRDVESGCSLAHYRFISPLVRPLLEGKTLQYRKEQGSQRLLLRIEPAFSQGRGAEAWLSFSSIDLKMPTKRSFTLGLALRLSESTDMVGIAIECLQSLGPLLKPLAQVAMGELAQLPAQDVLHSALMSRRLLDTSTRHWRPDASCLRPNAHNSLCADNNIFSSGLSYKFPEQVFLMGLHGYIPAFDEHNLQINTVDGADKNVVARNWPPLELAAIFLPHVEVLGDSFAIERDGGRVVRAMAIHYFIQHPELTEYRMDQISAHGPAFVTLQKPNTERQGRSKTQRVAKRRQ